MIVYSFFFFQAEDGIRDVAVTGVQTCALPISGRHPGDYSSKIDVKLTAEMPARCALEEVLLRLLDTLEANVPGTIKDIDTEFLHDLRVAVRRTRSAVKLCGDV